MCGHISDLTKLLRQDPKSILNINYQRLCIHSPGILPDATIKLPMNKYHLVPRSCIRSDSTPYRTNTTCWEECPRQRIRLNFPHEYFELTRCEIHSASRRRLRRRRPTVVFPQEIRSAETTTAIKHHPFLTALLSHPWDSRGKFITDVTSRARQIFS